MTILQAMNIESEKILLRSGDFLKQHGIEVWTEKEVSRKDSTRLSLHDQKFVDAHPSRSCVLVENPVPDLVSLLLL